MHHLRTSIEHARKRVLAFADDHQVTIAELGTRGVLCRHLIERTKSYWRNQNKEPGRSDRSISPDPVVNAAPHVREKRFRLAKPEQTWSAASQGGHASP